MQDGSVKKTNTGWIIIAILVIIFLAVYGRSDKVPDEKNSTKNTEVQKTTNSSENNEDSNTYHDYIKLDSNSITGATFDCDFSEFKSIIGKTLSIGDLNSSSGGWQLVSQSSSYTEYSIVSSSDSWGVVCAVSNSDDKVIFATIRTIGLDMNTPYKPTDYEIESFARVFAKMTGNDTETFIDTLTEIYISLYKSGSKTCYYEDGAFCSYTTLNDLHEFNFIAMTEEHYKENFTK